MKQPKKPGQSDFCDMSAWDSASDDTCKDEISEDDNVSDHTETHISSSESYVPSSCLESESDDEQDMELPLSLRRWRSSHAYQVSEGKSEALMTNQTKQKEQALAIRWLLL